MTNEELLKIFEVTGLYRQGKVKKKFRDVLEIKKKLECGNSVDLMVVMMNPGSSEPINEKYNGIMTLAKPDDTQFQIMKVMCACDLKYARIVNLSNLIESKSSCFYKWINNNEEKYSIFDEDSDLYRPEFHKELVKGVPYILAWGVNYSLRFLAKSALTMLKDENKYYMPKKGGKEFQIFHPYQRYQSKRDEWVSEIIKQLKSRKTAK
jgi:hypothetical protein